MESLNVDSLREGALILVDTAPIIYTLEAHRRFAARFEPLFRRHEAGEIALAVTAVTIAEVLTGPMKAGEEALARRYRAALEAWLVVDFTSDIAESAVRLRGRLRLEVAGRHPACQRPGDQCRCAGHPRSRFRRCDRYPGACLSA